MPQSNCSLTWPAPPCHCLLYSRCLPELLHAPVVLSPWPQSDQADASLPLRTGRPPRPGPTAARRGWLLHATASSAAGVSPNSMPRPSCHPGPDPVKPTPLCPSRPPCPGLCHLGLWHAPAAPHRRLTTDHHRRRLCSACQQPKSGRWLWTSPARPPPLDATSRLGPPPPDAISRPPRALVRYSSPLPLQMNVLCIVLLKWW
jgi:hypothetical protein